jgi:hypothetical protein
MRVAAEVPPSVVSISSCDRAVIQGRGIRTAITILVLQVTGQDADTDAQRPALLLCGDLNSDLNEGIPGMVHPKPIMLMQE